MSEPLRPPADLPLELRRSWPSHVTVQFVNSEMLIDPESPSAARERKLAQGKISAIAEVELFAGTPQQKRISRRSQPGAIPSPELYRETVNQLVADVRRALESWQNEQK